MIDQVRALGFTKFCDRRILERRIGCSTEAGPHNNLTGGRKHYETEWAITSGGSRGLYFALAFGNPDSRIVSFFPVARLHLA